MNQGTRLLLRASLLIIPIVAAGSCRAREKKPPPAIAVSPAPTQRAEDQDVASRTARTDGPRPPVIWLGLDGLDWELLDRLAVEGKLPNWRRLTAEGWSARLAAPAPLLSPLLWTSAATGVPPDVHRVLDFQEVDPKSGRKVPISGESRAVPAVWNLASAAGRKVGVVGWWATHPAEEVDGFFVSDRVSPLLFAKLPLAGVVFPTGLKSGVETVIERDGRVAADQLARFLDVPGMEIAKSLSESARASGRSRDPVAGLARIVGATRVSHRIARDLYDRNLPDLLALYLEGTDEVGHLFAAYTPPKLDCVTDADFARYRRVVETYYTMVDGILGQWMRRAAEDGATLLVHSDHGFKWGADRSCGFGSAGWATAAFWHRPNGVIAAWGTRVRPAQRRVDANLLDVAPSVLALLGLPADYRMPGVARTDAFRDLPPSARADVFPKVAVRRVAAGSTTREATNEYVSKLIALGYLSPSETRPLSPTGGNRPGMTEGAWNNLGVYFRDTVKKPSAARDAFQKSLALRRDYHSALFNMAVLERMSGDSKAAEKWFFRSVVAVGGDPAAAILSWSAQAAKGGDAAAARSALEKGLHSYPRSEEIARALAHVRHKAGDCRAALDVLAPFEAQPPSARTLNALALFQACLRNRAEVVRLLERSLALEPNQPDVARSLAAARGSG